MQPEAPTLRETAITPSSHPTLVDEANGYLSGRFKAKWSTRLRQHTTTSSILLKVDSETSQVFPAPPLTPLEQRPRDWGGKKVTSYLQQ